MYKYWRHTPTVNSSATAGRAVFDGNNIWVTNHAANSVSKLRASDGAPLCTFPVGPGPTGIAFDGANVWIANTGGATLSKR